MHKSLHCLLAPSILASALAAQEAQAKASDFLIPLHTMAADPMGGEYGLWAAGPDYKASFHDGFTFFPRRGAERDLVGWRWQTTSVRQGNQNLITQAANANTTEWRHALDHGAVTEVYDVLREGVEQSFVIEQNIGTGDIVVTGRITGDLQASTVSAAAQSLEFSDGERTVVRYGEAIAFDAAGTRTQVTTSFDGADIRLTLSGDFLEHAVYPVTIDPLTSALVDNYSGVWPIHRTAIGVDNSSPTGKVLHGITQQFAANDLDLQVLIKDKDFTSIWFVFADISTVWSTTRVDIAHVDGADRFVVAFQREYSATNRAIRLYYHDQNNTLPTGGTLVQPNAPLPKRWQEPRVCGSRGNSTRALLVFEEDDMTIAGSSNSTRVMNVVIFPNNSNFGTPIDLDLAPGPYDDNEMPIVERYNDASNDFTVVWRKYNPQVSQYSIRVARVDYGGGVLDNSMVLSTTDVIGDLAVAGSWVTSPVVRGYHVVAWVRQDAQNQSLETRRFQQGVTGPAGVHPVRTVASSSSQTFDDVHLAHDHVTQSHFALSYMSNSSFFGATANVARLGYSGGVVESHIMASAAEAPKGLSVAFGEPGGMQRFYTSYGLYQPGSPASAAWHELTYDLTAGTSLYGNTCNQNSTIQATTTPFAGERYFGIEVAPVSSFSLVMYVINFSQGFLPLQSFGMPAGCDLLVEANAVFTFIRFNQAMSGSDTLPLPLPDAPVLIGDLYVQAGVFPSSGTPFTTRGMVVQVR